MTSGVWLSIPLFYLAPLPIMIAGLGWSHWSAMIAALAGAAALGLAFGPIFFVVFLAMTALPAWWLAYLALLARPAGNGTAALEWYPPGRLVIWAALLGGLIVAIAIPLFGHDAESFRHGLRGTLDEMLRVNGGAPGLGNSEQLSDFLVAAVPPAAAVIAAITNMFNLWLAATVVKFSGRLKRPWPTLSAMTFPRALTAAFVVAVVLTFVGSLIGIVAGILSASLLIAYGVLGFAVLHTVTRGMASRIFVLSGVYGAVLLLGWPVLALCLLGLVEATVDLRARLARTRGPPAIT